MATKSGILGQTIMFSRILTKWFLCLNITREKIQIDSKQQFQPALIDGFAETYLVRILLAIGLEPKGNQG